MSNILPGLKTHALVVLAIVVNALIQQSQGQLVTPQTLETTLMLAALSALRMGVQQVQDRLGAPK